MRVRVALAGTLVASSVAAAAIPSAGTIPSAGAIPAVRDTLAAVAYAAESETNAAAKEALRIDLGDSDPVGLDLLPGISGEEAEAIAGVAGPGSWDLDKRLSETGLPPDRLREWAPYLALPCSPDYAERWVVSSTTRWDEERGIDSRMRVSIRNGHAQGSVQVRGMPGRADPTASIEIRTQVCEMVAGSIAGGIGGGDSWIDPIAVRGSRSTAIPATALRSGERLGARGIVVDRPAIGGLAIWRGPAGVGGFAAAIDPPGGIEVTGGGTARAGEGLGVRFAVGETTFRSIVRFGRGIPPALVLDGAVRGRCRGRFRIAWSLGPREDGLQGRVEGAATGRLRSLLWTATASVLGPGRPGRSSILGDFDLERVGRRGAARASIACGARPSPRLAFARPFPVRDGSLVHIGGSVDAAGRRHSRVRLRLAYVHGIVRIEGSGPAFSGWGGVDDVPWSWTLSCVQAGGT